MNKAELIDEVAKVTCSKKETELATLLFDAGCYYFFDIQKAFSYTLPI